MIKHSPYRRIFLVSLIGFTIAILLFTAFVLYRNHLPLQGKSVVFGHVKDGNYIIKSKFEYLVEDDQLFIVHRATERQFLISTNFKISENGFCSNCAATISAPQQDPFIPIDFALTKNEPCDGCIHQADIKYIDYLVTRQHNGGSAGYYMHHVFKFEEDEVVKIGSYLSCGDVRSDTITLIFTYHIEECPELLQVPRFQNSRNWEAKMLNLRDN